MTSDPAPKAARLWVADNPTRDFRQAKWNERPATLDKGTITGEVDKPAEGFTAFFVELTYPSGGKYPFKFSTAVRITPDTLPFPPRAR